MTPTEIEKWHFVLDCVLGMIGVVLIATALCAAVRAWERWYIARLRRKG